MLTKNLPQDKQDAINKASELLYQANTILAEAGLRMIYDSFNDTGVIHAIPVDVSFDESCFATKSNQDKPDASTFIEESPAISAELTTVYANDERFATNIPDWFH